MGACVELSVETAPFERIGADLAVAGFFLDEKPLRGAAGRADWRLCGVVSELLENGRLRGRVGEATLVPSMGRMAADRVLLLGLGRRSSFRVGRARDTGHAAVSRGLGLGARKLVLAPPVDAPEAFERQASGFVRGAIEAAAEGEGNLRMILVLPASRVREALEALERAVEADASDALRWLGLAQGSRRPASPGVRRRR